MKDWDFGFYGKGLEGYMHYNAAINRINEDVPSDFVDDEVSPDDTTVESLEHLGEISKLTNAMMRECDEVLDYLKDYLPDEKDETTQFVPISLCNGNVIGDLEIPLSVTITVGDSDDEYVEQEKPLPSPSKPLDPSCDLTPYYYNGNSGYEFEKALRVAMSDYFPEYKESYLHTDKFNSEIISEIFTVDRCLAFQMWKWQLAHFNMALHTPEIGHILTTMNYLDGEDMKWIFHTEKGNEWFWRKVFEESTVIYDMQIKFLQIALENDEIVFFHFLMELYACPKVKRGEDAYSFDRLLEEIIDNCWLDELSTGAIGALNGYVKKVGGVLRRAALQKKIDGATMTEESDDEENVIVRNNPLTKERCRKLVAARHRDNPLPDGAKYMDVVCVAGLFAAESQDVQVLCEGDRLNLVRESENPYDSHAVRVDTVFKKKLGYIPRADNRFLADMMDAGSMFYADIVAIPTDRERNLWIAVIQMIVV